MLLLGPINVLNDLLLKTGLTAEQITYFVWPLIQIGLVVTLVALWVAYATYLERKMFRQFEGMIHFARPAIDITLRC